MARGSRDAGEAFGLSPWPGEDDGPSGRVDYRSDCMTDDRRTRWWICCHNSSYRTWCCPCADTAMPASLPTVAIHTIERTSGVFRSFQTHLIDPNTKWTLVLKKRADMVNDFLNELISIIIILGIYLHYPPFCEGAQSGYKSIGGWWNYQTCLHPKVFFSSNGLNFQ